MSALQASFIVRQIRRCGPALTPVVCGLLALQCAPMLAQSAKSNMPPDAEIVRTITRLDREVFDAYNRCDVQRFGTYFSDDVEFYDDRDGLSVGRAALMESVHQYICGKVRRELVAGTLEVHPLHNYGAVEIGVHRFQHPDSGDKEPVGEGRFIHVWAYRNGAWKITRVISFAHHTAAQQ
jgi:ketosteroid isomerase-like protein